MNNVQLASLHRCCPLYNETFLQPMRMMPRSTSLHPSSLLSVAPSSMLSSPHRLSRAPVEFAVTAVVASEAKPIARLADFDKLVTAATIWMRVSMQTAMQAERIFAVDGPGYVVKHVETLALFVNISYSLTVTHSRPMIEAVDGTVAREPSSPGKQANRAGLTSGRFREQWQERKTRRDYRRSADAEVIDSTR